MFKPPANPSFHLPICPSTNPTIYQGILPFLPQTIHPFNQCVCPPNRPINQSLHLCTTLVHPPPPSENPSFSEPNHPSPSQCIYLPIPPSTNSPPISPNEDLFVFVPLVLATTTQTRALLCSPHLTLSFLFAQLLRLRSRTLTLASLHNCCLARLALRPPASLPMTLIDISPLLPSLLLARWCCSHLAANARRLTYFLRA